MRFGYVSKEFKGFVLNIKEAFESSGQTLFKQRNTIKVLEFNGSKYAIKSFKVPNFVNKIAYRYFRDSKAKRSYLNSHELIKRGIDTPKPIGYIEHGALLLGNSFYISAFFEFDFEIRDVLKDPNFKDREQILKEFVRFSYNLHNKGVYHYDYSPGNVLIRKNGNNYNLAIIDVNRMQFIDFTDELRFKNLSRFSTTLEDLEFIAKEYAKISGIDEKFAIETLAKYHNKHQEYLQRKKRLKALKGKK